jgi:hypothetical protein
MPNFGVNDNDRRTAEAMERIWAARRKEQVMSSVYTDEQFDKMLLAMGPFSTSEQRIIDYALALRQRAEQADASADTYALLLRKLTKDDTLLAAYRRSKNLDHRGVPVVSDVVLEMLRKEEAALGRAK